MKTENNAWKNLRQHSQAISKKTISSLFKDDPDRFEKFSINLDGLLVDYSKNLLTEDTIQLLRQLAIISDLADHREKMFSGEAINTSENRPALHTLLRTSENSLTSLNNISSFKQVETSLAKMNDFANRVRSGQCTGSTGKPFKNILHIGVGGSVIGPSMAIRALAPYSQNSIPIQFVSNIESSDLYDKISTLDPETTLILVASKTFLTQETMLNAQSAKDWIIQRLGNEAVGSHFAALSSNTIKTQQFGIQPEKCFDLWDWVGGRYSIWSAIGLPILISIGSVYFKQFLIGAQTVDEHFLNCPVEKNIPIILGLIGIWHRSILGYASQAIIPYDQRLDLFVSHIQQIEMESNGKSIGRDGSKTTTATSGVIWGETGTNAQHSFFQLLHQGSDIVPCDFLIAALSHNELPNHHEILIANCLAQSQTLMQGRNLEQTKVHLRNKGLSTTDVEKIAPHATFAGNRPSTTMMYEKLDPKTLGMLIAIYEHKTFVQGVIWNINSFDQWGVELGKELANQLLPILKAQKTPDHLNQSTSGLIDRAKIIRKTCS